MTLTAIAQADVQAIQLTSAGRITKLTWQTGGSGDVTIAPDEDATIFAESTSLAAGRGDLVAGRTNVGRFVKERRALLHFPMGSITPGSTVTSALLRMRVVSGSTTGTSFTLAKITSGLWREGQSILSGTNGSTATAGDVTWGYKSYNTSSWGTLGGDLSTIGSVTIGTTANQDYDLAPAGLSSVVQGWVDSPATNNGVAIYGPSSAIAYYRTFASRSANAATRPRLIVSYEPTEHVSTELLYDSSGRVEELRDRDETLLSGIEYHAFGPISHFFVDSIMSVAPYGVRNLRYNATYRNDGSLSLQDWTYYGTFGIQNINVLKQSMQYGPAGLMTLREDVADEGGSRSYTYDPLLRLTCETRGDDALGTPASSSDCTTSSPLAIGLFSYGDGASPTAPQDVRLTGYLRSPSATPSYVSSSIESSTYLAGSTQMQQTARSSGDIVYGYDDIGRRTFDYDSSSPSLSRRDYTYAPNGQLASISGTTQYDDTGASGAYTTKIRYDADARPIAITYDAGSYGSYTYDLFWDEAGRLSFASINSGSVKWYYHYLGNRLVAATRRIAGISKHFFFITDERGLVYRMVDEQGLTYWQSHWAASGLRALVGSYGSTIYDENWVPFALQGQIVLPGTSSPTGGAASIRPEISLNQRRAYDPLTGTFLQPDPADYQGRLVPEWYSAFRNSPTVYSDFSGKASYRFSDLTGGLNLDPAIDEGTCGFDDRLELLAAFGQAYRKVQECTGGLCQYAGVKGPRMDKSTGHDFFCGLIA